MKTLSTRKNWAPLKLVGLSLALLFTLSQAKNPQMHLRQEAEDTVAIVDDEEKPEYENGLEETFDHINAFL